VYVAPNAPKDRLVEATAETRDELHASLEPYIEQARATYPGARDRYLAGLPPQHSFFVVTRLRDAEGKTEQVFIAVAQIRDGKVTGRIWNDIHLVRGFEQGQTYTLPESDLIDWVISRPDGSEEGNFVGKFLDEYQSKH
jgi:uncharacterized protein YegJ (DUF2314 family)